MEAKKHIKNRMFSIEYFYGVKQQKKENLVLCSGLLTSYLSCCKLCTVLSESVCHEVHEGCLPHDNSTPDKTIHNLQLTSAKIRS